MNSRRVIRETAEAIRSYTEDSVNLNGALVRVGEIVGLDPVQVAVDDMSFPLDESAGDVVLGDNVRKRIMDDPLLVGDSLVLVLAPDSDWHAVDVISTSPLHSGTTDPGDGSDKHYHHQQLVASGTWMVEHNLGKVPTIKYFDNSGSEVEPGTESFPTLNLAIAEFSPETLGDAYCN